MVRVPGHVPPASIPPRPSGKGRKGRIGRQGGRAGKSGQVARAPSMDSHAIAVALASAAKEAKEKELSFHEILQRVIDLTGIKNPQGAMEEANRQLQEEIDKTLDDIKSNKELMEEAQGWESFAELLGGQLSKEQLQEFFGGIKRELH